MIVGKLAIKNHRKRQLLDNRTSFLIAVTALISVGLTLVYLLDSRTRRSPSSFGQITTLEHHCVLCMSPPLRNLYRTSLSAVCIMNTTGSFLHIFCSSNLPLQLGGLSGRPSHTACPTLGGCVRVLGPGTFPYMEIRRLHSLCWAYYLVWENLILFRVLRLCKCVHCLAACQS